MSEQSAKRFKKSNDTELSTATYDIKWQNNFLRWERLMNLRIRNTTFEERFFIVRHCNHLIVLQFPAITYRQLARLKLNPNVIPFNVNARKLDNLF